MKRGEPNFTYLPDKNVIALWGLRVCAIVETLSETVESRSSNLKQTGKRHLSNFKGISETEQPGLSACHPEVQVRVFTCKWLVNPDAAHSPIYIKSDRTLAKVEYNLVIMLVAGCHSTNYDSERAP